MFDDCRETECQQRPIPLEDGSDGRYKHNKRQYQGHPISPPSHDTSVDIPIQVTNRVAITTRLAMPSRPLPALSRRRWPANREYSSFERFSNHSLLLLIYIYINLISEHSRFQSAQSTPLKPDLLKSTRKKSRLISSSNDNILRGGVQWEAVYCLHPENRIRRQ